MRTKNKGASTTLHVLVSLLMMMTMFSIYYITLSNYKENEIKLNQESLALLKLKSAFSLFEKSLGTTWLISMVQAVFLTADESVGCGLDDSRVEAGYWYQRRPDALRSAIDSTINDKPIIPSDTDADKYNEQGFNPQICYPQDIHVKKYIEDALNNRGFLNLKDLRPEDADGVAITLPRKKNGDVNANIIIDLEEDSIKSTFTQLITAAFGQGTIAKETKNEIVVETSLKQMAAAGRDVTAALLQLGNGVTGGPLDPLSYKPQGVTPNQGAYRSQFETLMKENIITLRSRLFLPSDAINIAVETDITANEDIGVIPYPGSGLVLHYTATVTYTEPEKYYYHNERENTFEKRPITLTYKAEDYLPALDCTQYGPPFYAVFSWNSGSDMACCAGLLFSCGTNINRLPAGQQVGAGDKIKTTEEGGNADQDRCTGVLIDKTFECTPGGFVLT